MRKLVPHYETFWQLYVFPLRSKGSIWFRKGVDGDLESIAIANYSTYAALARARHKIYSAHEQYRFLEELYTAVQRSAELGAKLVNQFAAFSTGIARGVEIVSAGPIEQFIENRLKRYRNLLHDAMLAMPKDVRSRRVIPRPEYIDQYRCWTKVMYEFCPAHFVVAAEQVKADFRATCSLLEDAWKGMSSAHEDLKREMAFQMVLSKGWDEASLMAATSTSGSFFLGASSAACQPTSGAFVLPEGENKKV